MMKNNQSLYERIILRLLDDRDWRKLIPRLIMGLISFVIFMVLMSIVLVFAILEKGMV